jgi:hypothetical protein
LNKLAGMMKKKMMMVGVLRNKFHKILKKRIIKLLMKSSHIKLKIFKKEFQLKLKKQMKFYVLMMKIELSKF